LVADPNVRIRRKPTGKETEPSIIMSQLKTTGGEGREKGSRKKLNTDERIARIVIR
jgi:hypothetical protein